MNGGENMDEHEEKITLANELRERLFKIPRQNREYELLYQPTISVKQSVEETKVLIKFTLGYEDNAFACRIRVECDGVYVKVGSVGAYFDHMFIKGKPEMIVAEFVNWMHFARRGTKDGDYAILLCKEKPVGFMVRPIDSAYSYAFMAREIAGSGLKPKVLFKNYDTEKFAGNRIDCWYEDGKYLSKQCFGKGLKPVAELDLETRRTYLWSFLCVLELMKK